MYSNSIRFLEMAITRKFQSTVYGKATTGTLYLHSFLAIFTQFWSLWKSFCLRGLKLCFQTCFQNVLATSHDVNGINYPRDQILHFEKLLLCYLISDKAYVWEYEWKDEVYKRNTWQNTFEQRFRNSTTYHSVLNTSKNFSWLYLSRNV